MAKKAALLVFGLLIIISDIWLGIRAQDDPSLVLWFGLASAIAVPLGFEIIGHAIRARERDAIDQLAKVPEIKRLIEDAASLQEQVNNLTALVESQVKKQTIQLQKDRLEQEAIRILRELEAIDEEIDELALSESRSLAIEEISRLNHRIQARINDDVIFQLGSRLVVLNRSWFQLIPLGEVLFNAINLYRETYKKLLSLQGRNNH